MRIFLFIVDSLRRDFVGTFNPSLSTTPQIDQIAEHGTAFENAYAQSNWTYPSLYSIITGLYPSRFEPIFFNQRIVAPDRILPEILASQGYHTAVFSSFRTLVHPQTFGSHFRERRLISLTSDAAATFRSWLIETKKRENVFLLFHLGDFTHVPYCVPKSFLDGPSGKEVGHESIVHALTAENSGELKIREIFKKINARLLRLKPAEVRYLKTCYRGGIRFVDGFIGKCFDIVSNELPDFFFAIAADHGECFLEHGIIGHGMGLYNELIRVPLIVVSPRITPGRVDRATRLLDLYPTISDLAGIRVQAGEMDGISLCESEKANAWPVISDAYPLISVIDGYHKLISSHLKFKTRKERFREWREILREKRIGRLLYRLQSRLRRDELYDLKSDPGEKKNRRRREQARYIHMKKLIRNYVAGAKDVTLRREDLDIEEEMRSQLEQLGYL